jgi:hypothetical protein
VNYSQQSVPFTASIATFDIHLLLYLHYTWSEKKFLQANQVFLHPNLCINSRILTQKTKHLTVLCAAPPSVVCQAVVPRFIASQKGCP